MSNDHFIRENGLCYAGIHLLIELHEACHLDQMQTVEQALKDAVIATQSTLLHIHVHPFGVDQGISGVVVLAESHMSIHTWPERKFAALDLFTCGDAKPDRAIPIFEQAFIPKRVQIQKIKRGIID